MGGGFCSMDNNLSSINNSVSVSVIVGLSHVNGKNSTVLDVLIDFVTSIQYLYFWHGLIAGPT